jgi:anti-sigma regulatory factor (Ser/Thr protein kinase)
MLERRFPRNIGGLPAIFDFVSEFAAAQGLSDDQRFDVDLIVEELFTNMVKYNRDGVQDISIGLNRQGAQLILTLRDFDVEPFDPTQSATPAAGDQEDGPRGGGRGLHLVRSVADDVRYDYRDRNSTITVIKRLAV